MSTLKGPRPIVTTWDVFDTLVARFQPDPLAAIKIVQQATGTGDFVNRRLGAQAALDRVGQPYVLNDIYAQMISDGLDARAAHSALSAEIRAEFDLLVPIARNVSRVEPGDLIVSDMYMSPEVISSILFEICDLSHHRPIVRSNWGKHTGTIWPHILAHYVVRRHVGDNPQSDGVVPGKFGIFCEIVHDANLTDWEKMLVERGLQRLALIQREVRLRCMPAAPQSFHHAVVGPYLTVLAMFALHLVRLFGPTTDFIFLSRSADELLRVFVGLFPDVSARAVDISRRLARDPALAATLASFVRPGTLVVDVVGTGRSFLGFAEAHCQTGQGLYLLMFLENLLNDADRQATAKRETSGTLRYFSKTNGGAFRIFEHLLQAHYPPIGMLSYDTASGGVVRSFGAAELDPAESDLIGWKSGVITTFVRTLRRRGLNLGAIPNAAEVALEGLNTIMKDSDIIKPFTSFVARERMDWA